MHNEQIAMVCHQANKAFCESIGDMSQKDWDKAEQWQRDSAVSGVAFAMAHPDAHPSSQHDAWLAEKKSAGWIWGREKNAILKTHPCCVPYEELPTEQKIKDYLFKAVVSAFVKASQE